VGSVLIFANPIAGRGKAVELAERIALALAARGMEGRKVLCRPEKFAASGDPSKIADVVAGIIGKRGYGETGEKVTSVMSP
jgi:diacylglycerol kinase family enzyme